jgi:hypothetical protein
MTGDVINDTPALMQVFLSAFGLLLSPMFAGAARVMNPLSVVSNLCG